MYARGPQRSDRCRIPTCVKSLFSSNPTYTCGCGHFSVSVCSVWRGGWYRACLLLRCSSSALLSRLQELYYEIANVLNLMLEDMPNDSASNTS